MSTQNNATNVAQELIRIRAEIANLSDLEKARIAKTLKRLGVEDYHLYEWVMEIIINS